MSVLPVVPDEFLLGLPPGCPGFVEGVQHRAVRAALAVAPKDVGGWMRVSAVHQAYLVQVAGESVRALTQRSILNYVHRFERAGEVESRVVNAGRHGRWRLVRMREVVA